MCLAWDLNAETNGHLIVTLSKRFESGEWNGTISLVSLHRGTCGEHQSCGLRRLVIYSHGDLVDNLAGVRFLWGFDWHT